jgi:hypothetical protein
VNAKGTYDSGFCSSTGPAARKAGRSQALHSITRGPRKAAQDVNQALTIGFCAGTSRLFCRQNKGGIAMLGMLTRVMVLAFLAVMIAAWAADAVQREKTEPAKAPSVDRMYS